MKYGRVNGVIVHDTGSTWFVENSMVDITVEFSVERSVLLEFMDALRPIDPEAHREPIQAILDHSSS